MSVKRRLKKEKLFLEMGKMSPGVLREVSQFAVAAASMVH